MPAEAQPPAPSTTNKNVSILNVPKEQNHPDLGSTAFEKVTCFHLAPGGILGASICLAPTTFHQRVLSVPPPRSTLNLCTSLSPSHPSPLVSYSGCTAPPCSDFQACPRIPSPPSAGHCALTTLAFCLFLEHTKLHPASGPHACCSISLTCCSLLSTRLAPSPPSGHTPVSLLRGVPCPLSPLSKSPPVISLPYYLEKYIITEFILFAFTLLIDLSFYYKVSSRRQGSGHFFPSPLCLQHPKQCFRAVYKQYGLSNTKLKHWRESGWSPHSKDRQRVGH